MTGTTPSPRGESKGGQSRVEGGKIPLETVFWSFIVLEVQRTPESNLAKSRTDSPMAAMLFALIPR
jgi:hypothetical protein